MKHAFYYYGTVAAVLLLAACQEPVVIHTAESKPSAKAERSVAVIGTASKEILPNRLDLQVVIREVHAKPAQAVKQLRQKQKALELAIGRVDSGGTEVVIGSLALSDYYEQIANKRVKRGYEATTTLIVTMQDFDRVGDYMQVGSEHGATRMSTKFRSTELVAEKVEVRRLAIVAAKSKAEQMIELVGGRLGAALTIQEDSAQANQYGTTHFDNSFIPVNIESRVSVGSALTLRVSVSVSYEWTI